MVIEIWALTGLTLKLVLTGSTLKLVLTGLTF